MYKVAYGVAPEIMNEIIQLIVPPTHSVYYGRESASYLGPKLWELIPTVIRQILYLHLRKQ